MSFLTLASIAGQLSVFGVLFASLRAVGATSEGGRPPVDQGANPAFFSMRRRSTSC
jgi:hypothetical protein